VKTINIYDDSEWQIAPEYSQGTQMKILRDEEGAKTVLLKLPPGFYMAPHTHVTAEQHVLISGEYISEGKVFPPGTYQKFKAHENHGPYPAHRESRDELLIKKKRIHGE
jgi:anti-sigma factor ChrR (cupin superfamily)